MQADVVKPDPAHRGRPVATGSPVPKVTALIAAGVAPAAEYEAGIGDRITRANIATSAPTASASSSPVSSPLILARKRLPAQLKNRLKISTPHDNASMQNCSVSAATSNDTESPSSKYGKLASNRRPKAELMAASEVDHHQSSSPSARVTHSREDFAFKYPFSSDIQLALMEQNNQERENR